ncbi:hypothetical protein ACROYT_G033221 [Oculina patagonica]
MKGSLLGIFVFFAVFATAYSLKCYICFGPGDTCSKENLEKNKAKYAKDCKAGEDQCIRKWAKFDDITGIENLCGDEAACTTWKNACDKADGKCAVGCCKTDLCNAGSPVPFSVFLMTVCSALGLALLK